MISLKSIAAALACWAPAAALAATPILVHRDPGCSCCEQWAAKVKAAFGRQVRMVDDRDRPAFERRAGVPSDLTSCHTANIDGLVVEGHVPVADIKRVLALHPKGVAGLAVAGMPMGSPGMEMPGMRSQPYDVIAFGPAGRRVFAHHG